MRIIHKYKLVPAAMQILLMPYGAEILSVHEQRGEVFIWALVENANVNEHRKFWVITTDEALGLVNLKKFLGTVHLAEGTLVFHVFEID